MNLEERIDELYAGAPEGFVAARNALLRELRAEGDVRGAREVGKLRKPTQVAAAVNRLVRDRADAVEELLDLGPALREAQADALAGGGGAALRTLGEKRRRLIARLVDAVPGDLAAGVEATLEAATLDPAVADAVRGGRLVGEARPAGFGFDVAAMPGAPDGKGSGRAAAKRAAGRAAAQPGRDLQPLRDAAAEAERTAREARERADATRERLDAARTAVDEAAKALAAAKAEVDRLTREGAAVRREVAAAEKESRKAELAADAAAQRAWAAADRLRRAEQAEE